MPRDLASLTARLRALREALEPAAPVTYEVIVPEPGAIDRRAPAPRGWHEGAFHVVPAVVDDDLPPAA